jgi:hypothetical protein
MILTGLDRYYAVGRMCVSKETLGISGTLLIRDSLACQIHQFTFPRSGNGQL